MRGIYPGRTPLSWASDMGHGGVEKLLIETGHVEYDARDKEYGRTPLSWAARMGHEGVVKLLIETGNVDVDARDRYSRTPLSLASDGGHEGVLKLLLGMGKVDIDAGNISGQTPFFFCRGEGAQRGGEAVDGGENVGIVRPYFLGQRRTKSTLVKGQCIQFDSSGRQYGGNGAVVAQLEDSRFNLTGRRILTSAMGHIFGYKL